MTQQVAAAITTAAYTQTQKVLHHLANSSSGLTRQDAMVNLGVANVTARISDLDNLMYWTRYMDDAVGLVAREKHTHPATGAKYMRYYLTTAQRDQLIEEGYLVRGVDGVLYPTAKVKIG